MKRIVCILYIVVVAMIESCAGCGNTKDGAAGDAGNADFEQTMRVADSLYSSMQFRDAYDLYLQLLDSKEAEADDLTENAIVLNFGVETGIRPTPSPSLYGGEWHDLSGRKLSGKPTAKGVYIYKGNKRVIK